jgi:hypothetical protein
MKRRHFLSLLTNSTLALATGATVAAVAATRFCAVNRHDIPIRGLPEEFDGFRIALLSDFHHSAWVPASYLAGVVRAANLLDPDLIALTGDFVHRGREWVSPCFRVLAALRAPHGVHAVLGNHDHYDNAATTCHDVMAAVGINDLTNRGVTIHQHGAALRLGGVGDLWRDRQNLRKALGNHRTATAAILLSHNPDYAEEIRDERVRLVLSGHTHGGQCVLPLLGAPVVPSKFGQRYLAGLCQAPQTQVFVTRGVGCALPPIRINCPPEIALLTLTLVPQLGRRSG